VQPKPGVSLDSYDPTAVSSEIKKIQDERMKILKTAKVESRDIKVFNASNQTGTQLKQYLMDLEIKEAERLKELKLSEERLEESI